MYLIAGNVSITGFNYTVDEQTRELFMHWNKSPDNEEEAACTIKYVVKILGTDYYRTTDNNTFHKIEIDLIACKVYDIKVTAENLCDKTESTFKINAGKVFYYSMY